MHELADAINPEDDSDLDFRKPPRPAAANGSTIPPAAEGLDTLVASSLAGKAPEPRRWLVDGLVPMDTVTLLSGDGGTGKSLLALQLAMAVATGSDWAGVLPAEGRALYVSAEDDLAELHRRMVAIADGREFGIADLQRLEIAPLAGKDAVLAAPSKSTNLVQPRPLFAAVRGKAVAARPALIVLDTSADLFGGQENDRAHVRQFIGLLRGLAIEISAAVLLLSHPSVSGLATGSGLSGSTAWNNSVRSRLFMERVKAEDGSEPDADLRRLKTMKANYGPVGGEVLLRWRDGRFVPEHGAGSIDRMAAERQVEEQFLKLLDMMVAQGRNVSTHHGTTYAPAIFAAHPDAAGTSKKAFAAAMERLLKKHEIEVVEDGPPSRRRTRLMTAAKQFEGFGQ